MCANNLKYLQISQVNFDRFSITAVIYCLRCSWGWGLRMTDVCIQLYLSVDSVWIVLLPKCGLFWIAKSPMHNYVGKCAGWFILFCLAIFGQCIEAKNYGRWIQSTVLLTSQPIQFIHGRDSWIWINMKMKVSVSCVVSRSWSQW